jgi:mono/diheme cytochrome c family protein
MRTLLRLILIPMAIGAIVLAVASMFIKGKGFSTRDEPSRIETVVAMQFRKLAMPSEARDRKNTVAASPEAVEAGLAHWADHCATCHANDGSGDTTIGRNLYPKAPDMRKAPTQDLTDGELFYIIEHGVRLTGMPAWGTDPPTPEGDVLGWQLVHFIRHLPKLTPEEIARMEELNPKTPDEWREAQTEKDFLEGSDAPTGTGDKAKPQSATPHKH